MSLSILGLGTALPPHTMTQEAALEMSHDIICQDERQRRLMRVLFKKAAVKNRHTAVPHPIAYEWYDEDSRQHEEQSGNGTPRPTNESGNGFVAWGPTTRQRMQLYADNAGPLAKTAVERAFEQGGVDAKDVTHLVTVSCTGFDAPGVDIELIDGLGLSPTTERINVGYMGCHGAINGLRAAKAIAASEPDALVLLSATELCSLHYRFNWDSEGIIGNALFADGSAAILVAKTDDESPRGDWTVRATGSCLIPDSKDAMSWRVGDHGFEMRLTSEVAEKINTHLRPWINGWLAKYGYSVETVGSWAVHPGGPRILQAVEETLELPTGATRFSHEVLAELGNMSSPTVLFILDRLRQADAKKPCVALGFGPGLMAEAALLE